eukprot:11512667-Alexandrium_andersonii.AAC.1
MEPQAKRKPAPVAEESSKAAPDPDDKEPAEGVATRNIVISDEEAQRLQSIFGVGESPPKSAGADKAAEGGGTTPTGKEGASK